jgi:chorismate mutase
MLPEIESLRGQIDALDRQIIALITARVGLVLQVGEFKRQHGIAVYDATRERDILDNLASLAQPPLEPGSVRRIFERVIDEARHMEQQHVNRPR